MLCLGIGSIHCAMSAPNSPLSASFYSFSSFQDYAIWKNKPTCGQSYKASTIGSYESRVVNLSYLLVSMTLES